MNLSGVRVIEMSLNFCPASYELKRFFVCMQRLIVSILYFKTWGSECVIIAIFLLAEVFLLWFMKGFAFQKIIYLSMYAHYIYCISLNI